MPGTPWLGLINEAWVYCRMLLQILSTILLKSFDIYKPFIYVMSSSMEYHRINSCKYEARSKVLPFQYVHS